MIVNAMVTPESKKTWLLPLSDENRDNSLKRHTMGIVYRSTKHYY